jgi:hypothetical protein
MMQSLAQWDHRLRNRLTAIKLALQLLDRKTELSTHQRALAQKALDATETLASELFGSESVGEPPGAAAPPRRGTGVYNPKHDPPSSPSGYTDG